MYVQKKQKKRMFTFLFTRNSSSSIVINHRRPTIHKTIYLWINSDPKQFIVNLSKFRFKSLDWLLDDVDLLDINRVNILHRIIINGHDIGKKSILFEIKDASMNGRLRDFDYVDRKGNSISGISVFYTQLFSSSLTVDSDMRQSAVIKDVTYSFYDKNLLYVKLMSDKQPKILYEHHTRLLKSFALILPLIALIFGDNVTHYYSSIKLISLDDLTTTTTTTKEEEKT